MKLLKYIPLVLIFTLYSSNASALDCSEIKMDSSVNIIKKLKCKAGQTDGGTETSSTEDSGAGWKLWKKPEWMKKHEDSLKKKN